MPSIWTPQGQAFAWSFSSIRGFGPSAGAQGTQITLGGTAHVKSAWAQILAASDVARDVWLLTVNINGGAASGIARDMLIDIGVDPAGGTSYVALINGLLGSCASPYVGACGSGHNYIFPVWIKAGSTVAVRAQANATSGSPNVSMRIFGSPVDRRNAWCGTKVRSYGILSASSSGTAITPVNGGEGTWTLLGTVAANDIPKFWQFGLGINNATMTAQGYVGDLAIGASTSLYQLVDENRLWQTSTLEQLWDNGVSSAGYYRAKAGDNIYGRVQAALTPDTGFGMAAYGVI